jgi:hypothetical protein
MFPGYSLEVMLDVIKMDGQAYAYVGCYLTRAGWNPSGPSEGHFIPQQQPSISSDPNEHNPDE